MATVIQNPPTFWESFGTGLSSGLQQLAQHKLGEIAQRNQESRLRSALSQSDIPQPIQNILSVIPTKDWGKFIGNLEGLDIIKPQEMVQQGIEQQFEQPQLSPQREAQPQLQQALQQISPLFNAMNQGSQDQQQQQVSPEVQQLVQQQVPKVAPTLTGGIRVGAGGAERRHRELLELKKQALEQKQKAEAFKLTKQERSDILKKGRKSEQELEDLNRMEELDKEGNLDAPSYVEFLKRSGFDVPALMEEGSEEFNKIAANFIGGAKDALGGRVTNFELEQFLKTIPSLSQSPEGRKRVIANLRRIKRIEVEQKNVLKDIIKENKGVPPLDLLEQVDDRIAKKADKISEQFKKDLQRPVPRGEGKLWVGLGSLAGSIVGAPGRLLGALGGVLGKK